MKKLACDHYMHYLCVGKLVEKKETYPYYRQDIYKVISEGNIVIAAELIDMAYEMYSIEASMQCQIDELQTWNNIVLESKRLKQTINKNRRNNVSIHTNNKQGAFNPTEVRLMNLLNAYQSYEEIKEAKDRLDLIIDKLNTT